MARFQPALLGGLFIGVLSALPILNFANCCCLWVILGGMLTVYLDQQNLPAPIETSQAALGGLIAGAIGGLIYGISNIFFLSMIGGGWREGLEQALGNMPDMPPETADMLRSLMEGPAMGLLSVAISVPLYAVFGMLGALLGTAFFRKKPVAQ
jgi:hypothetical protein